MSDHPSGDPRFKLLEASMKRHQYRPQALLEVLHSAQEMFGSLSSDLLWFIAEKLQVPPSRVYGVATFYHFFTLQPKGRHACVVCLGTACYVKGAAGILARLEEELGVRAGHTAADGSFSLDVARCLGACGNAPAGVVDGEVRGHMESESLLAEWRQRLAQEPA